jgi:hypothetical protein
VLSSQRQNENEEAPTEMSRVKPKAALPQLAFNVDEFCAAHSISRELYYKLRRHGWGPLEMKLGSLTLISYEAAAAWRRQREQVTATWEAAPAA